MLNNKIENTNFVNDPEYDFEFLNSIDVKEFIHFTSLDNLSNIMTNGLMSRDLLDANQIDYKFNDSNRFDGKSYVNLSISYPNYYLFKKYYLHQEKPLVFLGISPEVVKHIKSTSYCFTSTNAASLSTDVVSVKELFPLDSNNNYCSFPYDNQSEFLVKGLIPACFIKTIYVLNDNQKKLVEYQITNADVNIKIAEHLFQGKTQDGKDIVNLANDCHLNNEFRVIKNNNKYICHTFDSAAFLSSEIVTICSFNELYSWKLLYSKTNCEDGLTLAQLSALSVLEKILQRGRITRLSESLEMKLHLNSLDATMNKIKITLAHQIQVAIVELIKNRVLGNNFKLSFDFLNLDKEDIENIVADLKELDKYVCTLFYVEPFLKNVSICYESYDLLFNHESNSRSKGVNTVTIGYLKSSLNLNILNRFIKIQHRCKIQPNPDSLKFLLKYIFRFDDFRPNQIDGIIRTLEYKDSVVLLPTGSGKSLIFQLLCLICPGMGFVIEPILSLIQDQVYNLRMQGIDRVGHIDSTLSHEHKEIVANDMSNGQFFILYVSPERFQIKEFQENVALFTSTNLVSVVAVDEAHCMSEWGHDFRPSYLHFAKNCREWTSTLEVCSPVIALTGTASNRVLENICLDLSIDKKDSIVTASDFDRPEISFYVVSCASTEKEKTLYNVLNNVIPRYFNSECKDFYEPRGDETNCGIVFCSYAGEKDAHEAIEMMHPYSTVYVEQVISNVINPDYVARYNGGMSLTSRTYVSDTFINNSVSTLVSTKAFGMGIDKKNIRWCVHYGIPGSLEEYYQEVGRCARDGKKALGVIILSNDNPHDNFTYLASSSYESNKLLSNVNGSKFKGDDISRLYFLHSLSYKGVETEVYHSEFIVKQILEKGQVYFTKSSDFSYEHDGEFYYYSKGETEKILYYLHLLGYVESYTINYDDSIFDIVRNEFSEAYIFMHYKSYIKNYKNDSKYIDSQVFRLKEYTKSKEDELSFICSVLKYFLVEFKYKLFEVGRRKAILNILEACENAVEKSKMLENGESIRKSILDYFSSENTIDLTNFASLPASLYTVEDFVLAIDNAQHEKKIYSELNRHIESDPDNFNLNMLQFVLSIKQENYKLIGAALENAFYVGESLYQLDKDELLKFAIDYSRTYDLPDFVYVDTYEAIDKIFGTDESFAFMESIDNNDLNIYYILKKINSIDNCINKEADNGKRRKK